MVCESSLRTHSRQANTKVRLTSFCVQAGKVECAQRTVREGVTARQVDEHTGVSLEGERHLFQAERDQDL